MSMKMKDDIVVTPAAAATSSSSSTSLVLVDDATIQPSIYIAYLIPNQNIELAIPITIESSLQYKLANNNNNNINSRKTETQHQATTITNSTNTAIPQLTQLSHPQQQKYLIVGRQSTIADIHTPHNSISRKHALLYYYHHSNDSNNSNNNSNDDANNMNNETRNGTFMIYDLGSKYGTTINEHRISSSKLALDDGDTICFGNDRTTIYTIKLVPIDDVVASSSSLTRENVQHDEHGNLVTSSSTLQQVQHQSQLLLEKAGEGLTGRAKHQAEIAAMMESFNDIPTCTSSTITTATTTIVDGDMNDANSDTQQYPGKSVHPNHKNDDGVENAFNTNDQIAKKYRIPITQYIIYNESEDHNDTTTATTIRKRKRITATPTCISIDPNGARYVVGSTDMTIQIYDFGNIVSRSYYKSIIPDEGYWPISCCYSNTGDKIIIGTGSVQPIIFNRDGEQIIQFIRGDMYITDQSKTVGHTASITGVDWHPFDRNIVLTSSKDGSVRLWNIMNGKQQFKMLTCDKVYQPKNQQGKRTIVLCIAYHPSGREFAIGASCGSIQIWNTTNVTSIRPVRVKYGAHTTATTTTTSSRITCTSKNVSSLCYNYDGTKLATRCYDDTVIHIWDATKLNTSSKPLITCYDTPTIYEQANVQFSPDGNLVCAGVSRISTDEISASTSTNNDKRNETGSVHFYDTNNNSDGKTLLSLNIGSNIGAVIVAWHTKINQIFVACSNGQIIVYFDPCISQKGAVNASGKVRKSVDGLTELLRTRISSGSSSMISSSEIITPLYNANLGQNKRKHQDIIDTEGRTMMEPERPTIGKHGSSNLKFQQYVADQRIGTDTTTAASKSGKIIAGKDPREALFQYNEGKAFVDRAYGTNPKLLAEKTAEQEEEEMKQPQKKKNNFL